ncbi:hypothetical protein [Aquibacillus sediminis]|uniref:hypothetical protein n=1 Tax=Aquibacillus sediminis TaxID=2574734 RepID=UPI00110899DD|nr:hypothetical protein [Aquibacillus sediminis]
MKLVSNQKGVALPIVLTIITVMVILIPILLYQVNTQSVQFDQTEAKIQAENLAAMGIEYFGQHVTDELEGVVLEPDENLDLDAIMYAIPLTVFVDCTVPGCDDGKESFKITVEEVIENETRSEKMIDVTYKSTGYVKNRASVEMEGSIDIKIEIMEEETEETETNDSV